MSWYILVFGTILSIDFGMAMGCTSQCHDFQSKHFCYTLNHFRFSKKCDGRIGLHGCLFRNAGNSKISMFGCCSWRPCCKVCRPANKGFTTFFGGGGKILFMLIAGPLVVLDRSMSTRWKSLWTGMPVCVCDRS